MNYPFRSPNRALKRSRSLEKAQADFRAALCDSFNTPVGLGILRELVSKTNVYINTSGAALDVGVLTRVARWVGDMLRMFGLGEGSRPDGEIGWGQDRASSLDKVAVRLNLNLRHRELKDPMNRGKTR